MHNFQPKNRGSGVRLPRFKSDLPPNSCITLGNFINLLTLSHIKMEIIIDNKTLIAFTMCQALL